MRETALEAALHLLLARAIISSLCRSLSGGSMDSENNNRPDSPDRGDSDRSRGNRENTESTHSSAEDFSNSAERQDWWDQPKEENNAYYYMENALFRELILWDSLAQLYNIYFDLNKDVSKVSYKKIIKELLDSNYKDVDFKQIYNL